jgi:hypothetical protein
MNPYILGSAGDGKSPSNAWSATQFNNASNWSATEDADKIDPGDTVYFSGTITSKLTPPKGGAVSAKITMDGYVEGSCTPKTVFCSSAAKLSYNFPPLELTGDNDYLIIKDFVFAPRTGLSSNSGSLSRQISLDNATSTLIGLEIRNCAFGSSHDESAIAIYRSTIEDFVIDNNDFYNEGTAQNVTIHAGSNGRITNNETYGGKTSMWVSLKAGNWEKNVVANNTFNDSDEEGFTIDTGGDDPDYVGFYMTFLDGDLKGRHALITGQSDATFTLDTEGGLDFDTTAGDKVHISYLARKNYTGYNSADRTGNDGPFLQYGLCYENLVEHNSITNIYSSHLEIRSLTETNAHEDSITQTCGFLPTGSNLLRQNSVSSSSSAEAHYARIMSMSYENLNHCSPATHYDTYYNNIIYNTVDSNYGNSNERVKFQGTANMHQYGYATGNEDSSSNPITPELYYATNNVSYKVYWPYIGDDDDDPSDDIIVSSNGTTVTIKFSENIDISPNYTTGDAWLEDADENKINLAYSSGDGTATIVFTAQSTISLGETWYFWFDGTDDSIQDSDGNDIPVYGYKTVTNNSSQ